MSIPEITFGHSLLTSRTLYVSDLDGTLLNSHSIVSDASARMLNTAIASGAHFTVATARTPATAIHLLSEIDMRLPGAVMTARLCSIFPRHGSQDYNTYRPVKPTG